MDRRRLAGAMVAALLLASILSCSRNPEESWQSATSANTQEAYEAFLAGFPESDLAAEARMRLEELAWKSAKTTGGLEACEQFLIEHPSSCHAERAKVVIDSMLWAAVVAADSVEAYQRYLETYPPDSLAHLAHEAIRLLNTVTEAGELVFNRRVQVIGCVSFIASGVSPGQFKYDGEFETDGGARLPQRIPCGYVICFLPGVRHEFVGRLRLPAKGESAKLDEGVKGEGESSRDGDFVFVGPISVNGDLSWSPGTESRFFEVVSQGNDRLVLELTLGGYVHVSGHGKVTTPEGKDYLF